MYPSPARTTRSLRREDELTGRLASFEVAVRTLGIGEFVFAAMADLEFSALDPAEYLTGSPEQLFARARVAHDRRPRDVQRAFGRKLTQIERRHCAAGSAVEHHVTAWRETVQTFLERGLSHAVIHDRHARVVRDADRK